MLYEQDTKGQTIFDKADALQDASDHTIKAAGLKAEGWIWLSISLGTLGTLGLIDAVTLAGEKHSKAMKKLMTSGR